MPVRMAVVSVVVTVIVVVGMSMAMMCVSECCQSYNVDQETQHTHNEQFVESL